MAEQTPELIKRPIVVEPQTVFVNGSAIALITSLVNDLRDDFREDLRLYEDRLVERFKLHELAHQEDLAVTKDVRSQTSSRLLAIETDTIATQAAARLANLEGFRNEHEKHEHEEALKIAHKEGRREVVTDTLGFFAKNRTWLLPTLAALLGGAIGSGFVDSMFDILAHK